MKTNMVLVNIRKVKQQGNRIHFCLRLIDLAKYGQINSKHLFTPIPFFNPLILQQFFFFISIRFICAFMSFLIQKSRLQCSQDFWSNISWPSYYAFANLCRCICASVPPVFRFWLYFTVPFLIIQIHHCHSIIIFTAGTSVIF